MGGFNAFEDLNPSQVASIRDWSAQYILLQKRRPRVVMDMSNHIFQVSSESRSRAEGIAHHSLFRRMAACCKAGFKMLCVFDGPLGATKRRHQQLMSDEQQQSEQLASAQISHARQFSPMIVYAKRLCQAMGIPVVDAPAEAESLCAWLQRLGYADAVFTGDADVLANGATRVLRYVPPKNSLNSAKASNAEDRLIEIYEVPLDAAPQFAMMALILGNDWIEGIKGIGKTTAFALSHPKTGFADRLMSMARRHWESTDDFGMELLRLQWHDDFVDELRTNQHNWLARKSNQDIPESFPNVALFAKILRPDAPYDSQLVTACERWLQEGVQSPLLPDSTNRIAELEELWRQPCPGFAQSPDSDAEVSPRTLQLFKSTLAPLLAANILIYNQVDLVRVMDFKEANRKYDIEVLKGPIVLFYDSDFWKGVRIPRFIFNLCEESSQRLVFPRQLKPQHQPLQRQPRPRANRGTSISRSALKQNAKITQFFRPTRSQSMPGYDATTSPARKISRHPVSASKSSSVSDLKLHSEPIVKIVKPEEQLEPAFIKLPENEEDDGGDTDVDEVDDNTIDNSDEQVTICRVVSVRDANARQTV